MSTPTLHRHAQRPVVVWIHGGGNTQDGALNYDGTDLAAAGVVVVTVDYRLGTFGPSRGRVVAADSAAPSNRSCP